MVNFNVSASRGTKHGEEGRGGRVDFEGQTEDIQHILNKETFNERLPTEVWSGLRDLREKLRVPRNRNIRNYHP